jgi:hypothetical protein
LLFGAHGAEGGVQLAGGDIIGEPPWSPDQIAQATQMQDSMLQQWQQIIPTSDPRWPQVVQFVQQQIWGQSGLPTWQWAQPSQAAA